MTGKEALIQVSKSCSALALEFGNLKIGKTDNEALQTLKEIVIGYDKYKRAFEILKDELGLDIRECCDKHKKAFKKDYQITSYSHRVFVTKDVAELLEEVIGNENT